ncbi:hypothetical protein N9X06_00695 [Paracoccaceae bacterium]|nr:hypothetical protein [Paracoccaceae bacterium]
MTNKTEYTSTDDYCSSPDYYKEKGKIKGYNEVMKWMNEFDVMKYPEVRKVANMMEMEFMVNRNRSLTPIADKLGIFISAR